MLDTSQAYRQSVKDNLIAFCCADCAKKHRDNEPYDGTYTARKGICPICRKNTTIMPAKKLFGYYKGIA